MLISLIVAASKNNVIGKNNQLIWHLPNDMKYFKNVTWAMPVIMGRRTFESIGKKPLAGRINIIITSRDNYKAAAGEIIVTKTSEEAFEQARQTDCNEAFVAGGGEIFKEVMPLAGKIYLTRVEAVLDGDTYFPEIDVNEWMLNSSFEFPTDDRHAYAYSFQTWLRNQKPKK